MLTLLLLAACDTETSSSTATCSLGIPTLDVTTAAPGDVVTITATPLTEAWDTAITVGSTRATVGTLDRSTCDACDDCKDTGGCSVCGECDTCAETCATCVETVSFTVPALEPGAWPVSVVNRYGRSEPVTLTVTAPADTGPVDTGPTDTGPTDTGPTDTGPTDTGPADTSPADTADTATSIP